MSWPWFENNFRATDCPGDIEPSNRIEIGSDANTAGLSIETTKPGKLFPFHSDIVSTKVPP